MPYDLLELNPGTGGSKLATEIVDQNGTSVTFPIGLSAFGVSGGPFTLVSETTGLPVRLADGSGYLSTLPVSLASVPSHAVTGPLTDAELRASAVPVSAASLPLPSGAATAANQSTANASLATLAGAVSGTEVQVDVLTMPTVTISDGGGAITVDGAVAVTGTFWQATQPVSLASVPSHAVTGPLTDAELRASAVTVSAASLPLPTGAATAANQTTANTSLATLAGAVSGTEVQVDVLTMPTVTISDGGGAITVDGTVAVTGTFWQATQPVSLASVPSHDVTNAGTFAVQAAQSGTWNITNVSGTISLPTGAATAAKQPALGTAGTASSDVLTVQGIASMTPLLVNGSGVTQPVSGTVTAELSATDNAVLDAIAASVAGTLTVGTHAVTQSGTWTVTGTGGTFPVTNAGTFAVQVDGAALTALQVIDNPVVVDDAAFTPATTSVMMAGFTFDDVSPDTVNEGDAGAARMSANRCQYVVLRDNAGNERGLNIDASGRLAVTLASAQTLATVTTLTGGGVAHDSPDSGNPHKVGAKAKSTLGGITLVSANDRTDLYADVDGILLV
ncbi:MAG: hypothetical protein EKK55_12545, partial [Rhodocyclaceae bacterium]